MDTSNLGLFKLMTQKLNWLTQRQDVLARNIANVDTPHYKPNDVEPFTFDSALRGSGKLAPTTTSPMHLAGSSGGSGAMRVDRERKPYEVKPAGNAVVLEEQMLKVGETGTDFQLVSDLYRKHLGMLKSVLGRGA
jgi:flagellar basal-body rod protein FlgB